MVRSLKSLHTAALAAILSCLLLGCTAGILLFGELKGTFSATVALYAALVGVAIAGVAGVSVALYRNIAAVRHDIRALVQMFNDVHHGSLRPNYTVVFNEFAVAQRYLRGWGRELVAEKQRLKDLGLVDHLSHLSNRRHFDMRLREIFQHTRTHGPSSVLMIDIDRFKQVNDQHGHDAGDLLIMRFAEALRANVRQTDVLARLGGDEFCIVYAYTPLDKATDLAERLRRSLPREIELKPEVVHALQWSGGLSVLGPDDVKAEGVLWRADQALLRAKETGRDRTCLHDSAAVTVPQPTVPKLFAR